MRLNCFLLATLCWLPWASAAQPSTAAAANPPAPAQPQTTPSGITASAAAPSLAATPHGPIQLDVVVTDKAGKPVTGLDRSDFTLLDNNRPARIQSFQAYGGAAAAPAQPTQIILIIDMVNIGFEQVSYSRGGIDEFLRSDGGRLAVPVSIYWYTDTGLIPLKGETAPTTDGNTLAAEIDATAGQLRMLNRSGGAWGAIERYQMSVQTLSTIARAAAGQPGHKLLIWIGPGWPMLDNPNMEMTQKDQREVFASIVQLSTELREGQMQIYSVTAGMPNSYTYRYESYIKGVKKPSQANLPNLDLKVLAVESGGLAVSPSNDLASQIEQCAREATAYYTIGFTPPPADGPNEYHELKVRVDKPGLTARTDTGYYNQPQERPNP